MQRGIKRIMGKIKKRAGFTLIEVMVAIFILIVIIGSVFALSSSSSTNLRESEAKNIAKNIATYTVEYIRSRNVTSDNNFIPIPISDWFDQTTNPSGEFPGLVDIWKDALKPNSASDTINIHPALPSQNYNTTAFYSSIQGYVSLADNPADSDPSSEDTNAKVVNGKYYDRITGAPYVVRFPLDSSNSDAIKNFTALSDYNAKIYTSDSNDLHYTSDATNEKAGTMAYRGFRVLTQIVAREKEDPDNPGSLPLSPHVQYYDVKVTVFWITGSNEQSYSILTQLVTY